jgi:hypothetical protein
MLGLKYTVGDFFMQLKKLFMQSKRSGTNTQQTKNSVLKFPRVNGFLETRICPRMTLPALKGGVSSFCKVWTRLRIKGGMRIPFFLTMIGVVITLTAAQENLEGRIFYAHGTEFTLVIGERQGTYGPGVLNSSEVSLGNGDMLWTGPGNFIEIQILPHGTGIKVAENTSIQLSWDESLTPVITILYGRIRVVSGVYAPAPAVKIVAGNGIAGVQGGDFCFDFMISPGDSPNDQEILRPKLQVYDFRGFSDIALTGNGGMGSFLPALSDNLPVIPVNERELVSVEVNSSLALIERKSFGRDIIEYWNQYNFRGNPPIVLPDTVLAVEEPVIIVSAPAETPARRRREPRPVREYTFTETQTHLTQIKNSLIIGGLSLVAAGAASQATAYAILSRSDPAHARVQANIAFIPIGLGISAIITSLFFNPAFP